MKAILVIDMPKIDENTKNGCRNCRYARKRMTLSEEYLCSITEQSAYVYDMKCPLKPMPSSLDWKSINETITDKDSFEYGRCCGRQELIDEILGGNEQ